MSKKALKYCNGLLKNRLSDHKKPLRKKSYEETKHKRDIKTMRQIAKEHMKVAQEKFKEKPTKQTKLGV